ncbi:MAG: transglutaminase-like domain-containing protein [Flavobacteriales bacterium]
MRKELLFFVIIIFCLFNSLAFAQSLSVAERVEKGKKLREKYPNEECVSPEASIEISFEMGLPSSARNKSELDQDGALQSTIKTSCSLVALKDNTLFKEQVFYGDYSTVNSILHFDENKRRAYVVENDFAYEDNNIFSNDLRYKEFSFALGSLGTESSYQIKETYKDVKYVTKFFFHDKFFTEKKTIIIDVPDWMEVEIREFNFQGYTITHSQKTMTVKSASFTRHEYRAENLNKMEMEKNGVNPSFTYPHIVIISKSYSLKGEKHALIGSVDDLYGWYSSLTKDLNYSDTSYINKTAEIIKNCKSDEERIKTIYYWVQDNIKYIAFESGLAGFRPMEAHLVYKNRYGDCKGMANLLKAMLMSAGFDARLTWIGTADIPYDYSLPSLCVDNHMICSLKYKGKWYFLDGTEKYQNFGSNAFRIRGRQVLIENPDKKAFVESVPTEYGISDLQTRKINVTVSGTKLIGKADIVFSGEQKNGFLYYKNYVSKDDEKKVNKMIFANNDPSITVTNLECMNCNQRDSALKFNYSFEAENKVNEFDHELYIDFDLDKEFVGFEKDTNRISNLSFHEYIDIKTQIIITIPAGYKVKHLPVPVLYNEDEFTVFTHVENKQGKLVYNKEIRIPKGVITVAKYAEFEAAMDELKTFYKDQIIFEK